MTFTPAIDPDIEYPDSDGKPMADNTEQYELLLTFLLLGICSGIPSKIRKLPDRLLPILW
jgi:hypothetical protein